MARIVQLSDLHLREPGKLLYRQIDTADALARAIERINALVPCPDLVVLSGDLVNAGLLAEYAHLKTHLARLDVPWVLLPGNHDEREALRSAFPEQAWDHDLLAVQRLEVGAAQLLLLDTLVPGEEAGRLTDIHFEWLTRVTNPHEDALLFLHHPPIATGIAGMDAIGLEGAARLEAWLLVNPRVRGVFCGHVHRPVFSSFACRPLAIAPAPAHQIALDLSGDPGALAWTMEPGGMLLIDWKPECDPVVHLLPVDSAPARRYTEGA